MPDYKINDAAAEDIEQFFDYGIDHFGLEAAQDYMDGMTQRFAYLALYPLQYQAVDGSVLELLKI